MDGTRDLNQKSTPIGVLFISYGDFAAEQEYDRRAR